jgi:hypothetical protein
MPLLYQNNPKAFCVIFPDTAASINVRKAFPCREVTCPIYRREDEGIGVTRNNPSSPDVEFQQAKTKSKVIGPTHRDSRIQHDIINLTPSIPLSACGEGKDESYNNVILRPQRVDEESGAGVKDE